MPLELDAERALNARRRAIDAEPVLVPEPRAIQHLLILQLTVPLEVELDWANRLLRRVIVARPVDAPDPI